MDEFHDLSREEAEKGMLGQEALDFLFDRVPEHVLRIAVSYRPLHVRRQLRHTRARGDDLPVDITPIITAAEVTREGRIIPQNSVVARDVLEPLARGTFSIGSVTDLDVALTDEPFTGKEETPNLWEHYNDHWRKLMKEVCAGWPATQPEYQVVGFGLIRPATTAPETVRQILALSDTLISKLPKTPLLANFARQAPRDTEPARQSPFPLAERLGHSNDEHPVADRQRDALAHLVASNEGDILAVNGPPGTGKTTMLLSAIAGEWVRAALARSVPPLIVAASTNNQAVTNIIDAFGKDFAQGEGPFSGRWLPDIKSFGIYLPADSKEKEASAKYQTASFFQKLETAEYLSEARAAYLAAARNAFPNLTRATVGSVIESLHACLLEEAAKLSQIDDTHLKCRAAEEATRQLFGEDLQAAVAEIGEASQHSNIQKAEAVALLHKWESWLAAEPILLSLFSFLPPVEKKRVLRARLFLRQSGAPDSLLTDRRIDMIDKGVKEHSYSCIAKAEKAAEAYDSARTSIAELRVRQEAWRDLARIYVPNTTEDVSLLEVDSAADVSVRFRLFLLATHYWEGRWIEAMEKAMPDIQRLQRDWRGREDRNIVEAMWLRRMMLTPCAVSTFATLPKKMICRDNSSGSWRQEYLFNHIDLLIVDEAGQVLPEVAGPSFSLAKRALVIGDTQQIEPISALPAAVDTGNLIEAGLLPSGGGRDALQALEKVGLTSRTGSTMRLAQSACRFHPYPELDRGLYLFEHRRCFEEIVSFCNELCYKGMLRPMRALQPAPLRPMSYLHIDGKAMKAGGSRYNPLEAQTIAAWLKANADMLTKHYSRRLEDIVGIVTPFGRQVQEIRDACSSAGIDVGKKGMTVGTVHALQGAERPVIIFSPVYSKHADGGFIDLSPSMLNVAVSRAKDSFIVFGDMDTLASSAPDSPRNLLAKFVSGDADNAIDFEVPVRADLVRKHSKDEFLHDAAEHDRFLLNELANVQSRLCIVSPWINATTMRQTGFITAIKAARTRGVEIDIYADPELTGSRNKLEEDRFAEVSNALAAAGVPVHAVKRLHSKLVWSDDALLVVGSFNWFSAHRNGEYALHETSAVYRGKHLGAEIQMLENSLKARIPR
ncbi:AAA domain-containing protein [Brucella pituitosa]|uniref:AAA domain-containing protein n=1 Tax=Brucella pituitosa TaxID=571256 RepID=UPI001AECAE59|nr:AAA domain-containing protein [Brucella pituitosa]